MNTRTLIAVATLSLAATGGALAQEATSDAWLDATTTQTRAQVRAELAQARATGSIEAFSEGFIPALNASAARSDVVAAVQSARASGELARIDAEAHSFDTPVGVPATRLAQANR